METNFCYRVDIDTWEGLYKGLPKCIKIANENAIPFTYYLSLGKYATGRNLFRIIKEKETIIKKIPAWKRNHWKDLFRGILLPPKSIGTNLAEKLQEYASDKNTEFHPHGYNHVFWANNFKNFDLKLTSTYIENIIQEYMQIFGKEPIANAAPNFVVNPFYLELLSSKCFKFASDFIYHSPFLLSKTSSKEQNSIVQLPVTEQTIESLILQGKSGMEIVDFYNKRFQRLIDEGVSYICMYAHAIYEPVKLSSIIDKIFELVVKYDMKALTHSEYYNKKDEYPKKIIKEVVQGELKDE